jgi:hypothetical protein
MSDVSALPESVPAEPIPAMIRAIDMPHPILVVRVPHIGVEIIGVGGANRTGSKSREGCGTDQSLLCNDRHRKYSFG